MKKNIHEISSGAVVYSFFENSKVIKYLVIKNKNGHHWSFPKGHIEKGETIKDTALREIKEETGLSVIIESKTVAVNTYSPYQNCIKDVYFFLARTDEHDFRLQESEIDEIKWLSYDEVLQILTYDNDKKVFKELAKK